MYIVKTKNIVQKFPQNQCNALVARLIRHGFTVSWAGDSVIWSGILKGENREFIILKK